MKSRIIQIQELASSGNLSELKRLIDSGHSQNDLDTALTCAVAHSKLQTADYLLKLGADLSSYNYEGVYFTAHNNELEGLKYVINSGVDINVNNGMLLSTAIITFINTKDVSMIEWLLENGASINLLTEDSLDLIERYGTTELKEIFDQHK